MCPSYARTRLTKGVTNESKFLSPMLESGTVADAVVQGILEGKSGMIHLPRVHQWLGGTMRGWPWWLQVNARNKGNKAMKHFVGYGEGEIQEEEDEAKLKGRDERKVEAKGEGEKKYNLEEFIKEETRLNNETIAATQTE